MVNGNDKYSKEFRLLRDGLLSLHAELLILEKQVYEDVNGKINSPGEVYALVLRHPSFKWLKELSTLIVSMDELMASGKKISSKEREALVGYVRSVLTPDKYSTDFPGNYYQALQRKPAIVVVHGRVVRALKSLDNA